MAENYDTKMKVTDLKNELKLRDLPITGTKTELQERLQATLIDGGLSVEDTAILEDILLEHELTEEEEKAILTLVPDENELLKSPISELNLFPTNPKQITLSPHIKITELKGQLNLRDLPYLFRLKERLQMALIDEDLTLEGTAISGEDLLKDILTDEKEKANLTLPPDENELTKPSTKTELPDTAIEDTTISGEDLLMVVLTDEEEKAILMLPADENELLKSPISELNRLFSTEKPVDVHVAAAKKIVPKRKSSITPLRTEAPGTVKRKLVACDENGSDSIAPAAKIARIHGKPKQVIKVSAFTQEERLQMRAKKFSINENKLTSSKLSTASVGAGLTDVYPKHVGTLKKRTERFGCVVSSTVAKLTADERLEKRKQRFGDICTIDSGKTTPAGKEKARQRLKQYTTATK